MWHASRNRAYRLGFHGILLIFLCLGSVGSAGDDGGDTGSMLSFIVGQQINTNAVYRGISYRATVRSRVIEPFAGKPFEQTLVFDFARRGDTMLITREASSVIEALEQREDGRKKDSIFRPKETPIVKRALLTSGFTVIWNDVATPRLDIYYAEDARHSGHDYNADFDALWKNVELENLCFGVYTPLYELVPQTPDYGTWRVDPGDSGKARLMRSLAISPSEILQDLTVDVSLETGLVTSGVFKQRDGSVALREVTYAPVSCGNAERLLPQKATTRLTDASGNVLEQYHIEFYGYREETSLPPLTLSDIGLPDGAELKRWISPRKQQPLLWKGSALWSVSDNASSDTDLLVFPQLENSMAPVEAQLPLLSFGYITDRQHSTDQSRRTVTFYSPYGRPFSWQPDRTATPDWVRLTQPDPATPELQIELVPPFDEGLLSKALEFAFVVDGGETATVPVSLYAYVTSDALYSDHERGAAIE